MKADVCFVLEGTYPYVAGGVSTWVDQTIKANPHLNFSILHLAANESHARVMKYKLPPNVVQLSTSYLHDTRLKSKGKPHKDKKTWAAIADCYQSCPNPSHEQFETMVRCLLDGRDGVNSKSLLSPAAPGTS